MAGQLPRYVSRIRKDAATLQEVRRIFGVSSQAFKGNLSHLKDSVKGFKNVAYLSRVDHCQEFPDTNLDDLDAKTLIDMGY